MLWRVAGVGACAAVLLAAWVAGCAARPEVPSPEVVSAEHPPLHDEFLDRLVGDWRIRRSARGTVALNTMECRWVLGHQFVRMHMVDVKRPPEYEAIVLIGFDAQKKVYVAHWCDVFGAGYSSVGTGTRSGDTVEFRFPYDDGPFFNTFTWHPDTQTWTFRGENGRPDGTRRLFMEDAASRD